MFIMLLGILGIILNVAWWLIIIQAVMSWLIAFNVINTYNEGVRQIWQVLERMTEPLYRPFRKIIPNFGGLDLTPMAVLLFILILQGPVLGYLYSIAATMA